MRDISRAYGLPVIVGLVNIGHLTPEDAGVEGVERILHAATDEQLVLEIGRRLEVTPSSTLWDAPITQSIEVATVHQLDDRRGRDDERAVASPLSEDAGEDADYDA